MFFLKKLVRQSTYSTDSLKKITKGNALQIQHYLGTAKISGYSILIKYICAEIMVWALFSVNRSFSTWCYQISLQRKVAQYKYTPLSAKSEILTALTREAER